MSSKNYLVAGVLIVALLSPSCKVFRRSKAEIPPPPPVVKPMPEPAPPVRVEQAALPDPPEIEPQEQDWSTVPPLAPGTPPPPKRRTVARTPEPAPSGQDLKEAVATAPMLPQLEEVLTPEQQRAYNQIIDANITRAQRTVTALDGRKLSSEQATYLERIRTFIQQATEARKTDLFRARNLAERASILAEDLLRSAP